MNKVILDEKKVKIEYVKMISKKETDYNMLLSYSFEKIICSNSSEDLTFAYNIILNYSIITEDYNPLYEISLILGFAPIIEIITQKVSNKTISEKLLENLYLVDNRFSEKILTSGQKKLFSLIDVNNNYSVVAPTSYGKTEIIIDSILNANADVVVIVPLIALLNQVKRDIRSAAVKRNIKIKLITHHDMKPSTNYKNVYVLTQERCLELIKKNNNFAPEQLFIDESHNLLKKTSRSFKLSEVIFLLKGRGTIVKSFSPALNDANSIKLKNDNSDTITINSIRDIKVYNYYIYFDNKKYLFMNNMNFNKNMLIEENYLDSFDYIKRNSSNKNIVYLNTPIDIERKALSFGKELTDVDSIEILESIKAIIEFVGEDYYIVDLLKKGIIYIHGQMPPVIRDYLIKSYNEIKEIKYLFTNSSILEGVNTTSDNLFILDYKISTSIMGCNDFINLKGRVNRLGEIFKNNDLMRLICNIHILCVTKARKSSFINTVLKPVTTNDFFDKKENPYLSESDLVTISEKKNEWQQSLEKSVSRLKILDETFDTEDIITEKIEFDCNDDIKKQCILNDINTNNNFSQIEKNIDKYQGKQIDNIDDLLYAICEIFEFKDLNDYELLRLTQPAARNFYKMLLNWQSEGKSIKHQASLMYNYYKKTDNDFLYVGAKNRGNVCAILDNNKLRIATGLEIKEHNLQTVYVLKREVSKKELYNICVIKTLLENNFISYKLMPYIETLNDMEKDIIKKELYEYIKYGTNDQKMIILLQEGMSNYLSRTLISNEKYLKFINFNEENVLIDSKIIDIFEENDLLKIELEFFI
jgi:hypothetical protein